MIKSIKLNPGNYYLQKEGNSRVGDSGPKLISLKEPDLPDGTGFYYSDLTKIGDNGEIYVGCRIECGSITARSYSAQDYWLTSKVTEILSFDENDNWVKFKTLNSVYIAGVLGHGPESKEDMQ